MNGIISKIETYLKLKHNAYKFYKLLEKSCDMYVIGGLLRDLYIYNTLDNIKDIDIVIEIKDSKNFDKLVKTYKPRINAFGGYKFKIDNIIFDIWELDNTWAYKSKTLDIETNKYIENLQYTVFLNIDSIVYDIQNNKLYKDAFDNCIETKTLDIILETNPEIDLNILRAIVYAKQYNLAYSNRLKSLIHKEYELKSFLFIERLIEIQYIRYGYEILSKEQLEHELENILNV